MADIYENRLLITGSQESITKVKALIINSSNEVDFSLAVPMPQATKGLLGDSDTNSFSYNKVFDNRIGTLTPEAFLKECQERYKSTNDRRYNIDSIDQAIIESDFYDASKSVESIIEDIVNDMIAKNGTTGLITWETKYRKLAMFCHAAMNADHISQCTKYEQQHDLGRWTKQHWGSKGNAHDSFYHAEENHAEQIDVYFSTKNGYGDSWFESLLPIIQDIELNDIEYFWGDSSFIRGGTLTRCDDGELMKSDMSTKEAMHFLDIDEEDQDQFLKA